MVDFLNLCKNENIKIYKKKSTIIFIFLILFALLVALLITYYLKNQNIIDIQNINSNVKVKEDLTNISQTINFIETNVKDNNYDYEQLNNLRAQYEYYKYAIDKNIVMDNGNLSNYYKYNIIEKLIDLKSTLYNYNSGEQVLSLNRKIEKLTKIIENNDFNGYIENEKEEINYKYENNVINDNEKQLLLYITKLIKKYNVGKLNDKLSVYKNSLITNIKNEKEELLNNYSLSIEDKEKLSNDINLAIYRLDNRNI